MSFNIEGIWNGAYSYNSKNYLELEIGRLGEQKSFFRRIPLEEALKKIPSEKIPPDNVPFSLKVKKGWFNSIKGTIQDDPSISNIKDIAKIYGKLRDTEIYFTKVYPLQQKNLDNRRYEYFPNGNISLIGSWEPHIYYHGFIIGNNEIKGSWMILPIVYHIKGLRVKVKESMGNFYMFRSGTSEDTEHPIYVDETSMEELVNNLAVTMKSK